MLSVATPGLPASIILWGGIIQLDEKEVNSPVLAAI